MGGGGREGQLFIGRGEGGGGNNNTAPFPRHADGDDAHCWPFMMVPGYLEWVDGMVSRLPPPPYISHLSPFSKKTWEYFARPSCREETMTTIFSAHSRKPRHTKNLMKDI